MMRVYILRTLGTIHKIWYNLDDARECLRETYQYDFVHEGEPLGRYMSEWQDPLTEEIYFLDQHEVIGFPTPETHEVGHAGGA